MPAFCDSPAWLTWNEDPERRQRRGSVLVQAPRDPHPIHGMHPAERSAIGRVLFDWMRPMKCHSMSNPVSRSILVRRFLDVVLAEVPLPGLPCRLDGVRRLLLADREDHDFLAVARGSRERVGDARLNFAQIVPDRVTTSRRPCSRLPSACTGTLPRRCLRKECHADVDLAQLLALAVSRNASDLHLSAGVAPMIRVDGEVARIDMPQLTHDAVHSMVHGIMNDKQRKDFETQLETDFSFEIPELARFRVNVFRQNRGCAAVFRAIPTDIPTLDDLAAPPSSGRCDARTRPRARHGTHRLRQVNDTRRDDRPHQPHPGESHHHDRGSDRISA